VLNQPMDPCGCSNLICATNTLFYDVLRDTKGTGGFFRYADTYLIGVGCEPGDFNQLDVWPMHKFVGVLQPTAEAVLETINDRRITLLVLPEVGVRLPRRGGALTLESLLAQVVASSPTAAHRSRARGDVGCSQQGGRELCRAAIFSTPGVAPRAGTPAPPAASDRPRAAAQLRAVQDASRTPPRRAPCWRDRGAAAGPPGGLARSAPTIISCRSRYRWRRSTSPRRRSMPRWRSRHRPRVAALPPEDEDTGDYELRRARCGTPRSTRSSAAWRQFAEWEGWDWISASAMPAQEHHAVRETVGVWDESPLQKWLFRGPTRLPPPTTALRATWPASQSARVRYGAFCDERGRSSATARYNTGDNEKGILAVTFAHRRDGDHFRSAAAAKGLDVEGRRAHGRTAAPAAAGPEVARAAGVAHGRRHRLPALLPVPRGCHRGRRRRPA